ncbi:hypothetical protein Mic7113_6648 (plasmid) [Allocoleopsis franciscana PCC 7113]|uniref:Uncharacterized protein n=1 Tax=Allocoleopsis franciscana PCC 7113 TaxID=1173027 RepID=K9WP95_9CYAN|nr:hypothetical protein Mic7113_6648 [Allocoleopsis franciscana PCC 7113]
MCRRQEQVLWRTPLGAKFAPAVDKHLSQIPKKLVWSKTVGDREDKGVKK